MARIITAGPTVTDTVVATSKVFAPVLEITRPTVYRYISSKISYVRASRGGVKAAIQDDGGVLTTYTVDINDVGGGGDVPVHPAATALNDAFYFGMENPFGFLTVDITTAATASAPGTTWEYWDGAAWSALSVTDASDSANGFGTAGTGHFLLSWTPPADWGVYNSAGFPVLYYVRIRVSNAVNYTVGATLEQAWSAIPADEAEMRVPAFTETFLRLNPGEVIAHIRDSAEADGSVWFTEQPGS